MLLCACRLNGGRVPQGNYSKKLTFAKNLQFIIKSVKFGSYRKSGKITFSKHQKKIGKVLKFGFDKNLKS